VAEQMLVQLLANSKGENQYRWGVINSQGQWNERPHSGDEAALLADLTKQSLPVALVIPGDKVVLQRVGYSEKEKRHLRQLLPYQLEESVIGDVENLHFAVGDMSGGQATVAYIDDEWFGDLINRLRESNVSVQRCVTDFQLLAVEAGQWLLWLVGDRILANHASGIGFSIYRHLAEPLMKELFSAQSREEQKEPVDDDAEEDTTHAVVGFEGIDAKNIYLYADNEESLNYLQQQLPEEAQDYIVERTESKPPLTFFADVGVNLCQGPYAKRLPLDQWWQAWRSVAVLSLVAVSAFFAVTLFDVYQLKNQQTKNQQAIEASFRTAIPQGRMTGDPVRQLRNKLGKSDKSAAKSSQAVYLLSLVAPVLKERTIDLTTLAYNNGDNELRINIEADSFGAIEQLRKQLSDQGLQAELQNSSRNGAKHKARLRITASQRG